MAALHVLSPVMIPIVGALGGTPCVMPTIVPALEESPQHATYDEDAKQEKISVGMAALHVFSPVMIPIVGALGGTLCVMPTSVPALEEPPQNATYDEDDKEEKISVDPAHDTYEVVRTSPVDAVFVVREQHAKFRRLDFLGLQRVDSTGHILQCSQEDISVFLQHRRKIVGMMTERAYHWGVQRHTLMLAVDILDRYLAHNAFRSQDMVYLGTISLVIAAKHEELRGGKWLLRAVEDMREVEHDVSHCKKKMISMEMQVLSALQYNVCQPTYMTFLGLILLDNEEKCVVYLTCFLLELTLFEVAFKQFPPLMICASCILVARKYQGKPEWPPMLRDRTMHTNALGEDVVYSAMDLATTTQMVVDMRRTSDTKLWVHIKYSNEQYGRVANVTI